VRLATLGFENVYDYVAGKADWGSYGLPLEGRRDSSTRADAHARTDVPVCGLGERLADVREQVRAAGWDTCFVVDERRVVLGRLGHSALARDEDVSAEEAMTRGPSTVRPSYGLDQAVKRMQDQSLSSLPVTRSDGVVLGLLLRDDAEQALSQA
jgi:predicted transcriptional regulator